MLAIVQFYASFVSPYVRPGIVLLAMLGLWLGLRRTELGSGARMTTWLVVVTPLLVWFAAADEVARSGFYQEHAIWMRPLSWAVGLAWLAVLVRSKRMATILAVTPAWWLVALQTYRASGGALLLMTWSLGRVPGIIALPTGIGDCLVGLLAPPAAAYLWSGRTGGTKAAIAWNILGLADFAIGFCIGTFVPFGLTYPVVMVPAFLAPLSVVFHGLSIWQLTRTPQTMIASRFALP